MMSTTKGPILVVDDDTDTRAMVELILQESGYEVISCDGGKQALDKLKVCTPILVLLDIMMPEVDGYAVLAEMKQKQETSEIPVIMLTAKDDGDEIISGYQQGADYYIPKPFTTKQLLYGIKLFLK